LATVPAEPILDQLVEARAQVEAAFVAYDRVIADEGVEGRVTEACARLAEALVAWEALHPGVQYPDEV
jgi:hypothetical protein